ncbi:MAG: tetratricopeptide repeat protein [bacterium]|nr:tetratricopeptide repeat protein [bacterium]
MRKHWGRIAEIEERVSCSNGYLNKLSSGMHEFKLDLFLKTLDALEIEPASFFARSLGIQPRPDEYLVDLVDDGAEDRAFERIARATRELEDGEPAAEGPERTDASHVAAFVRCSVKEQRRRLRHTGRYRNHAFVGAYLEHLDELRTDNATSAAKLAETVAVDLIPALPGPQEGRLSLQCRALGVFGSARRSKMKLTASARALEVAIELSRRHRLREDTANLLLRACYLLKNSGHLDRALALNSEALVIFVELGSKWDIGRALLARGAMNAFRGDYEAAVLDSRQALRQLEGSPGHLARCQLTAYQCLGWAYEKLGDLDAAERWLARGVENFNAEHAVDRAKLQWSWGTLAFKRGEFQRAEELLSVARETLAVHESALQGAMITLDLLSALLAQGKTREAAVQTQGMTILLSRFKNNRYAQAAIVELISTTLEGKLSQELIGRMRNRLNPERALAGARSG